MNDEIDKPEVAKSLSVATEGELQRLVTALELDESFARIQARREKKLSLPVPILVAIIGLAVPLATCVHNQGVLALERERFASERTLELLRLALDERMPEAIRQRILEGLSGAANVVDDPVIQRVAEEEKQGVATQLQKLEDDKNKTEQTVKKLETTKKTAEQELQKNPGDPARVKNVELIKEQYDEQRLRLDHLKFRLGQGGLPPNPPLREPPTNP